MKHILKFKLTAAILAALLILSALPVFAAEDGGFDTPDTTTSTLIINPRDSSFCTLKTENTTNTITVPVAASNETTLIRDLFVTVTNSSELPFDITPTCRLETVDSWGSSLVFAAKLTPLAKPGKYTIVLSCTYTALKQTLNTTTGTDAAGNNFSYTYTDYESLGTQTVSLTYYVEVVNPSYETYMSGEAVRLAGSDVPEKVSSGDRFTVSASFANNFPFDLDNVVFTLTGGDFVFDNDSNTKTVAIGKNGKVSLSWSLIAPTITESGVTQLTVTAEYKNNEGTGITKSFYIALNKYAEGSADPKQPKATVEINSFTAPQSVKAGEVFETTLTLTNTSEVDASKVTVTVTADGTLKIASTNPDFPSLKAGESKTLTFKFTVPVDSTDVFTNLTATAKVEGSEVEKIATAGVAINEAEKAALRVESAVLSKENTGINTSLTLTVKLANDGAEADAKNVTVVFTPPTGISGRSANRVIVEKIAAGDCAEVTFDMYITDAVSTGTNYQSIAYTVNDVEYSVGTLVTNPEKSSKPGETDTEKPTIIIDSYDFGGESVMAGSEFTLSLDFLNTSNTAAVKNMKITVSSGSDTGGVVFVPSSSSNTFFVESLGAKQTVSKSITLTVRSDAEPKSSSITVEISSDNGKDDSETITIPIRQELRFNMNTPSDIGTISMQDEGYLSVGCSNMGKSTIYNVNMKITGDDFSLSESEYFAGNMTPGQAASHQFYVTPTMAGDFTGTITYTYENSSGETFTDSQTFNFSVIDDYSIIWDDTSSDPGIDDTGDIPVDGEPTDTGIPTWVWFVASGGVLAVAAVIVITVIVKKRRENNEDDDY